MQTKDFYYNLPAELIAQYPTTQRGTSRMLLLDKPESAMASIDHFEISDIVDLLPPETVVVLNNSKVRRARLIATTQHGGEVELLLLKKATAERWEVMLNRGRRRKPGEILQLTDGVYVTIESRLSDGNWLIHCSRDLDEAYLEIYGHLPLPPYISRADEEIDDDRYQTVYAEKIGSAAAPTAGLHFTSEILDRLQQKGIKLYTITLHVGLGTFLPVRTENITDHRMHQEDYYIDRATAEAVNNARKAGNPVLAVGTTSVRALESAWKDGGLVSGEQSTTIFLYPGYQFKVADMLLTNFHTPESTLLMLVSAFAGKDDIFSSYRAAIKQRYRFFSYGDAMLINRWSHPLLRTAHEPAQVSQDAGR